MLRQFLLGRREVGTLITITVAPAEKPVRCKLSPAAQRRVAAAQRKRWAAAKAA